MQYPSTHSEPGRRAVLHVDVLLHATEALTEGIAPRLEAIEMMHTRRGRWLMRATESIMFLKKLCYSWSAGLDAVFMLEGSGQRD